MKRSQALISLSHEHHHALFVAKLMRDATEVEPTAGKFADFWNDEGALHFRIEEEVLLPGSDLPGPSADPDVARVFDEHLDIRRRALRVLSGDASIDDLHQLGTVLADHVRFEERQLFPRIESSLDAARLEQLGSDIERAETDGQPDA